MLWRKLFGFLVICGMFLVPVILQADPVKVNLIFNGVSSSDTGSWTGGAGRGLTAIARSVTMLGNQTSNLSDLTPAIFSGGSHGITAAGSELDEVRNASAVPEPASLVLFGIGLVGLGVAIRLKHSA